MSDLTFVTGNSLKYRNASESFLRAGIHLSSKDLEIHEIQSEDAIDIAKAKSQAAYGIMETPVLVSDDSWKLLGLNGFPGAYMKSMNHWFSVEDWARLTKPLTDRRVVLSQIVVFQSATQQRVFTNEVHGELLKAPSGKTDVTSQSIITIDGDNGKSIAEVLTENPQHYFDRQASKIWNEVAAWYKDNTA